MIESENFYRFSDFLLNLGAKVLREKFMVKYVGSSTFQNYLKLKQPNLSTLLNRNILKQEQFDILYPSNGTPSIDDLDITLLCLMFRNLDTNTQPSDSVWTSPLSTDMSYQADVTRIRIVRNTMYGHLKSASMDTETYIHEINALKPIFHRLKHYMTTTQLDDLIHIVLNEPLQKDLGNEIKRLKEEIEKLHEHDIMMELLLNCSLLLLLLDLGTLTLQWYFEKQCAVSCSLEQFLNSKKTKLEDLCIQNIINEKEKNLLLSTFLLEKLDISLMARLLIHLCEIMQPMRDWTEPPEAGDKSPGADILRIWNFKDDICNRPTSAIPRAKFHEHWSCICEALSRLSDQLDEKKRIHIRRKIEGVRQAGWGSNAQLFKHNYKEVCKHLQTLPVSKNSNGGSNAAVTGLAVLPLGDKLSDEDEGQTNEDIQMPQGKDGKICIIKCYADLKLELERDTVMSIAKDLFKKEKHKDVLEEIAKAERRRLCVDQLLKRVLQEEATGLHIFFDLLKTKCPERARKLAEIKVTDKDRTNFTQVSESAKIVPHRMQNGLKFEQVFFQCSLQDAPEKVDKIADLLLSQFLISICDHSQIIQCNDPMKKMHTLLEKIQSCHFDSETEVQNVLGSKLYTKWKQLNDVGSRQGPEHQGIWHYLQERIQQFKEYLIEHFRGYRIYFVQAYRGSLVLKFVTLDNFDVKLLKPEAVKTKVWDMIKTLCPDYQDMFKEPVHLTIFFKPPSSTDSAEIHFHLETSSEKKINEECSSWKLGSHDIRYIVEEMNPESLKKWMFNKLQLDEDTKMKLVDLVSWKVMSRRKKMKILLSIVETLGDGYELLEKYCEEHDTFLYAKVFKKPRQMIVEENPEGAQQNEFSYEKGKGLQMLSSTWIDFTVDPKEKDKVEGVSDSLIDEKHARQLEKEDAGNSHEPSQSTKEKMEERKKEDRALEDLQTKERGLMTDASKQPFSLYKNPPHSSELTWLQKQVSLMHGPAYIMHLNNPSSLNITVKPVLRNHCCERPPVLRDQNLHAQIY